MSPAAPSEPLLTLVLARLGTLHLAVPAGWVAGACQSATPPTLLPRHRGAVASLLSTAEGCVPVVELARWVRLPPTTSDLPPPPPGQPPCYLLLSQDGQRLALRVDELLGLRRVPGARVQRMHHHDDPEELFDAVLPGAAPGEPTACVLEPQRLMRLLSLWCDDASKGDAGQAVGGTTSARASSTGRQALVRAAGQRLAVDMRYVAELMPSPVLKTQLAPGGASAGFTDWRGRTLAVLRAGWLQGVPATSTGPLALVLSDEQGRAVALPVDELLGIASMPAGTVPPDEGDDAWRGERWADDLGTVELLRVPALLDALPESTLARQGAQGVGRQGRRNDRPYFVLQAGRTAALPIDDVLAVVATGNLPDNQLTLDWRGRPLPLRGQATAGGVVVVLQGSGDAVALRVERLLGLVPAGAAEVSALPGVAGGCMLHLPTQAASYAIASAAELLHA